MKKIVLTKIHDNEYSHIITFLTFETNVEVQLTKTKSLKNICKDKKVLVDLALVSGLGEFRFVAFSLNEEGTIDVSSREFVSPPSDIVNLANKILLKNKIVVITSFLPKSQKDYILNVNDEENEQLPVTQSSIPTKHKII